MVPKMRQERIGYCAWCGAMDHHLVDDLCPGCHTKTVQEVLGDIDDEPLDDEFIDLPFCIRRVGLALARLKTSAKAARLCN